MTALSLKPNVREAGFQMDHSGQNHERLIGDPPIRQRTLTIPKNLPNEPGLRIQLLRTKNLLNRIPSPIRLDKPGMPPGNLNSGSGQPGNTQPIRLPRPPVEPLMRGLHMKRRVGPIFIQVKSAQASACEPAQQLKTVTWTQMVAYITHGDARCGNRHVSENGTHRPPLSLNNITQNSRAATSDVPWRTFPSTASCRARPIARNRPPARNVAALVEPRAAPPT